MNTNLRVAIEDNLVEFFNYNINSATPTGKTYYAKRIASLFDNKEDK